MGLFSRRALQRMVNENAQWLTRKQTESHVRKLNSRSNQSVLADEWEISVLNAFSKLGAVIHESDRLGASRPDIHFQISAGGEVLLADVTTVSDKGIHRSNPYEVLRDELWERTKKVRDVGINGWFSLYVGAGNPKRGESQLRGRGASPVRLKIPTQNRWKAVIFNRSFECFLTTVIKNPSIARQFTVQNDEADVRIGWRWGPDEHLAYTITRSKKRNPVFQALCDKRNQLAKAKFAGPKGVIICDGGCALMQDRGGDWCSFGLDDVVKEFLREHKSINFVVALTIRGKGGKIGPRDSFFRFHCIHEPP